MPKNLTGFISRISAEFPDQVVSVRRPIRVAEYEVIAPDEAPVKQVVLRGDEIDIRRLPIVKHYEGDLSEVVTMAAVMKDPDTGIYDVSFIKLFPKGPRSGGVSIHSPHLERILAK